MRAILRRSFGARHCDIRAPLHKRRLHSLIAADDLAQVRRIYPRLDGICGHRVTCFGGLETVEGLRFFTILREPVQRFVSHFLHSHRGNMEDCKREDLIAFCADPLQRNLQTRWLCGGERVGVAVEMLEQRIGFVGITEAFDETLILFRRWLDHPALEAAYASKNRRRGDVKWPLLDDPELRALIEDANKSDIEVYRHANEVIFPRQKEAFGPGLAGEVEELRRRNESFQEPPEPLWARIKRSFVYKLALHVRLV